MTFTELVGKFVAVNVRSEEEAERFVKYAVENGFAMNEWSESNTLYDDYKSDTCYIIERDRDMFYCDIDYYSECDYEIVTIDDIDDFSFEEISLSSDNIGGLLL